MKKRIERTNFKGTVNVPPSKTYVHKYLIGAALANGVSRISNVDMSRDVISTLESIKQLGADYSIDGNTVTVTGTGGNIRTAAANESAIKLNCRESGASLRFLIPVSLTRTNNVIFSGSEALIKRGIIGYEPCFGYSGVKYKVLKTRIGIKGSIKPGCYRLRGSISPQFASGLLFSLPLLEGDSKLFIYPPFDQYGFIDMTLDVLKHFGIKIKKIAEDAYLIKGGQTYKPCDVTIEGDWSSAAFFCALNYIDENNNVKVRGLRDSSLQPDRRIVDYLDAITSGSATLDVSNHPYLVPVLFSVAAQCHGATFLGTRSLVTNDVNILKELRTELKKFGAKMEINRNSVVIMPSVLHAPSVAIDGHHDHRLVMALSVLLTVHGGIITNAEAVKKSYPGFFKELEHIKYVRLPRKVNLS
ncbi:MAG: hypothetical protein J6Z46_07610 [Lachnospiraceae bacterium]|nr:hypothetical protein [Lachnospiraceae bacterium]